MKDKKIKQIFKRLETVPDKDWVEQTRNILQEEVMQDVTESNVRRISKCSLSNLLTTFNMSAKFKIALAAFSALLILFVGGGILTVSASDSAVPGDLLYGIDRAYESVQMALKTSENEKLEFALDLLEERSDELETLEEENADTKLVKKGIDNLEDQEDQVKTRLRKSEDNENSDEGELERIRQRLENQLEENLEFMNKMQKNYQQENDESLKDVEDKINEYKKGREDSNSQGSENPSEGENSYEEKENESNSDEHDGEGEYQEKEQNENMNGEVEKKGVSD